MPDSSNVRTISFKALQRARTTLEDFVSSYFFYHRLRIPQDFFQYLDVLVYVESTIYQLDEDNEALAGRGAVEPERCMLAILGVRLETHGTPTNCCLIPLCMVLDIEVHRVVGQVLHTGESVLATVLEEQGLMDDRIRRELRQGDVYWRQERQLCAQMLAHTSSSRGPVEFTVEDVILAHEAKSFDYRVLNLLLYRLRGTTPDEALLQFLMVDEWLVDIGDDLTDYEDDVLANSFNIFRGYVHLYGPAAEMRLIERISGLEKQHAHLLATLPVELQTHFWERHKEASRETGSDRWQFPRPILDELAYREDVKEMELVAIKAAAAAAAAAVQAV